MSVSRRLKKRSVLDAEEASENDFSPPTSRAPLNPPQWPPELAPPPPEVSSIIGLSKKKSDTSPHALQAVALECIDKYRLQKITSNATWAAERSRALRLVASGI
ncbi:hypothetical protein ElyMa_004920800 [Elysia marginata]|uniref:Uncharacterized protein n=1 Tax=Elysia marginata TaxID=1093978 RepID=A0AAV4J127_9GAST|nr:hypothetical protein ElyMa_004920800 [Elysia marginata]